MEVNSVWLEQKVCVTPPKYTGLQCLQKKNWENFLKVRVGETLASLKSHHQESADFLLPMTTDKVKFDSCPNIC